MNQYFWSFGYRSLNWNLTGYCFSKMPLALIALVAVYWNSRAAWLMSYGWYLSSLPGRFYWRGLLPFHYLKVQRQFEHFLKVNLKKQVLSENDFAWHLNDIELHWRSVSYCNLVAPWG